MVRRGVRIASSQEQLRFPRIVLPFQVSQVGHEEIMWTLTVVCSLLMVKE